jgi:hypothetical protein
VLIDNDALLKIVDFGVAAAQSQGDTQLTKTGYVIGSPKYMAPEQILGKKVDERADIYSLGVIMYELLTGRVPFEGPEAFVLGQILFVEPPPPSRYRPDLDPRLEAICLKAMAKNLDRRFATMGELAMAVGDYFRSAEAAPRLLDVRSLVVMPEDAEERPSEFLAERADEPSHRLAETAEVEPVVPELAIEVPESGTLWKAWRQWTAIVEHFTLHRFARNVNHNTYKKLHNILVAACRARAAKAQGPRQEFYLRLVELVLPWMTPTVLASTDREILFSLLSYCRQFEQELLDPTELLPEPGEEAETQSGWWLVIGLLVTSFVLALIGSTWVW